MRLALAIGVIAVALAGAVYIHQRHVWRTYPAVRQICTPGQGGGTFCTPATPAGRERVHPSWDDPVAVLIGLGGIAIAVGIAYRPKRPT